MPVEHVRETDVDGVVYRVKSHYSAAGTLDEILKRIAMEMIRAGGDSA